MALHWFRRDLRLHDNPAFIAAIEAARSVFYPVYIIDGDAYELRHCSPLRAQFLIESLQDLDASLRARGSQLYIAQGDPTVVLPQLWHAWKIHLLSFEQDQTGEPYATDRDAKIEAVAFKAGLEVCSIASQTLFPLESYSDESQEASVPTSMKRFTSVFVDLGSVPAPLDQVPPDLKHLQPSSASIENASSILVPLPDHPTKIPWPRSVPRDQVWPLWNRADCEGLTPLVHGGETRALKTLIEALDDPRWVAKFEKPNTIPASIVPATTRLSPYVSWGCLSIRKFWYGIEQALSQTSIPRTQPPVSLHGQLMWREFNYLMARTANAKQKGSWSQIEGNQFCRVIPWGNDPELLERWKQGRTGYPWIDACMRQLLQTGWMHHLARHAVACFLTRGDLWQSWVEGAAHFESFLLDADYAINNFNWLWLSCSGFFYQYFRCYSPISFQQKNDPSGRFIRHFVPELKNFPDKFIYEPWKAPSAIQRQASCIIGQDYPRPIVDHAAAMNSNKAKMAEAYRLHNESSGGKEPESPPPATSKKRRKVK